MTNKTHSCFGLWLTAFLIFVIRDSRTQTSDLGLDPAPSVRVSRDYMITTNSLTRMSLTGAMLLANLPQFLISLAYVAYSSLVPAMCATRELMRFSQHRAGLRVSRPQGAQRSTPYLSLPYRYALPITITMALLHWAVSEGIFLVDLQFYDVWGNPYPSEKNVQTCGWNPQAIFAALVISFGLIIALLVMATKRYPVGMPLAGTNSLAIARLCRSPRDWRADMVRQPLMWGVFPDAVASENDAQVTGFSAWEVMPVDAPLRNRQRVEEELPPLPRRHFVLQRLKLR